MRWPPARSTPWIGAAFSTAVASALVMASTAAAATPTELGLSGPSGTVRYGAAVTLDATLKSAGQPLPNRTLSLLRDGAAAGSASTNAAGKASFKLKATRNGRYQARFSPASPQDVAAYQPASSTPLDLVVRPLLRVKLSSPLRAGRQVVGIPRERLRISGRLLPNDDGQVTIRVLKGRRELRRATRAIVGSSGAGRFGLSFKPRARGTYRIRVQRHSGGQLGAARSASVRLLVVRPSARSGSRGAGVRALQRRLNALGYLTPVTGSFGASTSRAALAFRKANGMSRGTAAGRAVFRRLERGGGAFKLRYPKAGRHAEFDWSRQVLVLAEGARVVRVVHASSGKPSTPTVFGNFRFYSKTAGYNAKGMYFSNYFIGGYAIHGYESVPNFPASHGCIRIPIASAVSVYRWVQLGNRISVYR